MRWKSWIKKTVSEFEQCFFCLTNSDAHQLADIGRAYNLLDINACAVSDLHAYFRR